MTQQINSGADFQRAIAPDQQPDDYAEASRRMAEIAGITAPVEHPFHAAMRQTAQAARGEPVEAEPQAAPLPAEDWHAAIERAEAARDQPAFKPQLDEPRPLACPPNAFWDCLDA